MYESLFWISLNAAFIGWWWNSPSSTIKGVVMTLLTVATLLNLVALYGQLHTL